MQLLDVTTDLGPGATPAHLEAIVKGLRVAADVARDAETIRIRRAITERMKYPTDDELRSAVDRLPEGDETGPRYHAVQQLRARDLVWQEGRGFPPELWFDYLYRNRKFRGESSSFSMALSRAGYDRALGTPLPFPGAGAIGLEVIDPILYDALVADELARSLPDQARVRTLRYENPFLASIFGKKNAEKTVSTTASVLEVARDFGSMRRIGQADAVVAEETVGNRIVRSDLELAILQQELLERELRNERTALENAAIRQALGADQQQRRLIDEALRRGRPDIADAIRSLESGDAQALGELGHQPLELEEHWEPDDEDE